MLISVYNALRYRWRRIASRLWLIPNYCKKCGATVEDYRTTDAAWQQFAHKHGKHNRLEYCLKCFGKMVADAHMGIVLYPISFYPKTVCLCGSTRFYSAFLTANAQETLKGHIVLAPGIFAHSIPAHLEALNQSDTSKAELDALHTAKINLADEVLVIDVDGYIGDSTRAEIRYAQAKSIPVRYWSQEYIGG